jgi:hypothetical protein
MRMWGRRFRLPARRQPRAFIRAFARQRAGETLVRAVSSLVPAPFAEYLGPFGKRRRHEWRRGTPECVRHINEYEWTAKI